MRLTNAKCNLEPFLGSVIRTLDVFLFFFFCILSLVAPCYLKSLSINESLASYLAKLNFLDYPDSNPIFYWVFCNKGLQRCGTSIFIVLEWKLQICSLRYTTTRIKQCCFSMLEQVLYLLNKLQLRCAWSSFDCHYSPITKQALINQTKTTGTNKIAFAENPRSLLQLFQHELPCFLWLR